MKKDMTEQEAYLQLAALCAQAEHCQQEMRDKMRRWELDETVQNRIIDRLIKERYVDDDSRPVSRRMHNLVVQHH